SITFPSVSQGVTFIFPIIKPSLSLLFPVPRLCLPYIIPLDAHTDNTKQPQKCAGVHGAKIEQDPPVIPCGPYDPPAFCRHQHKGKEGQEVSSLDALDHPGA